MRFGFRLPGPFRVGISSKGRLSAGVNLGPVSVSGGIGGRRRPAQQTPQGVFVPGIGLEQAVQDGVADGWRVDGYTPGQSAYLTRGWKTREMRPVSGGVLIRGVLGTRGGLLVAAAVLAVVGLCCCLPLFTGRH